MGLLVNLKKKVNGFSLDVAWEIGNELAVLFGYSGAGKSMTLQLIAGLMKPDKGFVRLNNRSIFDSASNIDFSPQKRSVGYVFQDLSLFPHMTALNNILYGSNGMSKSEKKHRAGNMIDAFHLEGLEKKYPAELSGGQKQRVAFARALMRKPDVLLLDEPFSALDNPLRIEMRKFLREIKKRFNVPIVLVTHDFTEAITVADTLIIYANGRVIQTGSTQDVIDNPWNTEVEILINDREAPQRS